jgi:hypothetical protein
MEYQIDPQAAYAAMLSGQRNMFMTSALGITMFGFSEKFKHNSIIILINIIGLLIFLLSSFIGIKVTEEFDQLLGILKKKVKKDQVILINQIKEWGEWRWINYTYIIFLIILFIGLTFVKINNFKIKIF